MMSLATAPGGAGVVWAAASGQGLLAVTRRRLLLYAGFFPSQVRRCQALNRRVADTSFQLAL